MPEGDLIRSTWAEYASKLYTTMKEFNEHATGQEYMKALQDLHYAEIMLSYIKEGLLVEIAFGRPDIEFWQKWFVEGDTGIRDLARRPWLKDITST